MPDLRSTSNRRLKMLYALIFCSFLGLAAGLYFFQIMHSDRYTHLASNNRLRMIRFPPVRGELFDRHGTPLAVNVTTFDIMGYPLDIERENMVETLAALLSRHGIPATGEELGASLKKQYGPPYRVVRIVGNITLSQMADLVADPEFPQQLFPIPVWRRTYPAGSLAANVTGFVGEISEQELRTLSDSGYIGGDLIGKGGVERQHEAMLRGTPGEEYVEVDARGRKVKNLSVKQPGRGVDLLLSLDLGAQRLAVDLMKDYKGAIIVMDVKTGEVLVSYSSPSFDNNLLAWGVSSKEWDALVRDPANPMMDRTISGAYPPASTFKVLTALAALEEKVVNTSTTFRCSGSFKLGPRTFRCWRRSGHGSVNLLSALQNSCDVYFYQVGLKLGIDKLMEWGDLFELGRPTGIDLPGEVSGTIAGPEWKQKRLKEKWYLGDTVNYSIGQGFLLMTPIQIARMYAAIANGGILVQPHFFSTLGQNSVTLPISKKNLEVIQKGLDYVVRRGTGRHAASFGVTVAGKTGTAQNAHGDDHALFAGYAPAKDPKYVAVAMIEAGLHGGSIASPMVGEILSYLLVPESRGR